MTMPTPITVEQDIFKKVYPPLQVVLIEERRLTTKFLDTFLNSSNSITLGISAIYGKKSELSFLAIATDSFVLLIQLSSNRSLPSRRRHKRALEDSILCNAKYRKLAFDVERLATALYLDHGYRINNTVDIQSLEPRENNRGATATLHESLGEPHRLNMRGVSSAFRQSHSKETPRNKSLALRAWSSCIVASLPSTGIFLRTARTVNTLTMPPAILMVLAKSVRDHDRLVSLKPTRVKNDISSRVTYHQGNLQLELARFATRVRKSDAQTIEVKVQNGGKTSTVYGHVKNVKGRSAKVSLNTCIEQGASISISTLGRDDPTNAEMDRTEVVLTCLQRANRLFEQDFAARVFLGRKFPPSSSRSKSKPEVYFPTDRQLNPSQTLAVKSILSNSSSDRVCLIQGPPGTGKTTVIAASVHSFLADPALRFKLGSSMWLMAQSNVAVKNIAEKLAETNFLDFKILVSLDFHFQWHEHLYSKIEPNLIRSDKFANIVERLAGSRIILCTLSMLSHPSLLASGIFKIVPVNTVILDEASQIEVGNYLPLLSSFGRDLRKLVFIGDDKQLAPFGQDDIGNLRSVFELEHLQTNVVFLDTQYRMPKPLGNFLSRHVYDNKLRSVHSVSTRKSCRLVDIHHGEERKSGNSWVNAAEVQAVIRIAQKLAVEGKSYRIITPYDAQRGAIEDALKTASLAWEDKCFNVDSFQGNEADYIILSVVRSDKVGFLKNLRRSNVMLSRCKKSMIICTNRQYLEDVAAETLLGKLAKEWRTAGQKWITWKDVLANRL